MKETFAIDIGNSRIKVGAFDSGELKKVEFFETLDQMDISKYTPGRTIISSVADDPTSIAGIFAPEKYLLLDRKTKMPVEVNYRTPETLGLDRLAGVIAAHHLYQSPCLVIDLGSCITYDIIDDNAVFQGGAITPGISMRFKAMNKFTANLPDLTKTWEDEDIDYPGRSTKSCMSTGTINGIIDEMEGMIARTERDLGNINVVMTGGDSSFFETKLKARIFVRPNLVLIGLNQILIFNEED